MTQLVLYGFGKLGRPIYQRLAAEFESFRGESRCDPRALRDGHGQPCDLTDLTRPIVLVCVPPQVAARLISDLVPMLGPGATLIDLGNTPPDQTARLARAARTAGVSHLGVGVATGPEMAQDHCSLTVGVEQSELSPGVAEVLGVIAGPGGRYAVVGPPFAGHLGKVLFNPAGYVCTYAVAGACSILLRHGLDPRQAAEILEGWCEDGADSYLARVAVACFQDGSFAEESGSIAAQPVSHSGVASQWLHLMADCEFLPPVTAAAVSTRIGQPPLGASTDHGPIRAVIASARRVYEGVFSAGVRELLESVDRVAETCEVPDLGRCGHTWEAASLLSGDLYTRASSPDAGRGQHTDADALAGALGASRPLITLMRRRFGGHPLRSEVS